MYIHLGRDYVPVSYTHLSLLRNATSPKVRGFGSTAKLPVLPRVLPLADFLRLGENGKAKKISTLGKFFTFSCKT